MKKFSAQVKINIWYTAILIVVMIFVLAFIVLISDKNIQSEAEDELDEAMIEFIEDIDFEDDDYELDDDIDFYEDGVSFSVYDEDGIQVAGIIPAAFPGELTLKTDEIQTARAEGKSWLVQDVAMQYNDEEILWVRGVVSLNSSRWVLRSIYMAAFIIAPLVVAIGSAGGYFVTKRALKPVEESYEREKRFTADASHELRTPVSAIIAQSEYGLETESEEERKEALRSVLRQARRMSGLIGQLLQLSRMTNGMQKVTFEEVELGMLIHMVAEEMQEKADRYQIEINVESPENIVINGNQDLLMRLFLNLIDNAIVYGRTGGYVNVCIKQEKNRIACAVTDNGIGIAKEEIPNIWERFYRADKSRNSSKENNSGLGLAIVKWIVQAHHGEIRVESRPETGSTFYLSLPVS